MMSVEKVTITVDSNLDEFQDKLDNLRKALEEFNEFELKVWQVGSEKKNPVVNVNVHNDGDSKFFRHQESLEDEMSDALNNRN